MGDSQTGWIRLVVREIAAALGVLSLILLAIAHQPVDAGGRDLYRLADGSIPVICGLVSPEDEPNLLLSGCDVCRISGGIFLPDAPCDSGEKVGFFDRVEVFDIDVVILTQNFSQSNSARAPPVSV